MNKMIRRAHSTLGKALILCALLITPAVAFDLQEAGGTEQHRRRFDDELTFTQIDVPGATDTTASGINERGQIVGVYRDAGGVDCPTTGVGCHGFLLDEGTFTTVDVPGAVGTQAGGIDRRSEIVGFFIDGTGALHGFLLEQGAFTQIDVPGATGTLATEINDRGQVVGTFLDAGGAQHGFLLDKGVFIPIDFPGAAGTAAFGINNRGQIAGLFGDIAGAEHGFLLDDGMFTQIDVPGGTDTNPNVINDRGQIVGHVGPVGAFRGFLLDKDTGVFNPIDFPGATQSAAIGINNRGQIVGYFSDAEGVLHGFLVECDAKKSSRWTIENAAPAGRMCNGAE